jgi:O-antigen ligase
MADYFGITQIGAALLGGVNASGRQSGLASHPNNLGVACAIAVPVAMWLFTRHPRIGFLSVAVLLVGAFVTGSRGAQAGAALAVVLTLILVRETRRIFVWIAAGLVLGGFLLITFAPDVVSSALQLLRFLDPSTGADASDTGRSALAQQAITDFSYNPAFGVGFEILTNAHSVPLQLLSSGGIVLATAIISLFAGSIRSGWKLRKSIGGLTGALLVSVIVWLAQSVIENQLVDRYLYFPVAIIVALTMHPDLRREQTENHRVTLMPNRSA